MNVEEYLNQLNESQREAVVYNEGPSLVVAGAGSGKTRVLTYKIAYLLQLGLPPYSILALTRRSISVILPISRFMTPLIPRAY